MPAKRKRTSRPAKKAVVDLTALRIEAGKRGEGWCGCKWKWGDDLVGALVSECAYHADVRNPPAPPRPRLCAECRWLEPPQTAYTEGSTRMCASPRQPLNVVDSGREFGYASVHRNYDFLCGRRARWFEPAPEPAPVEEMPPTNEMGAEASAPEPHKSLLRRIQFWLAP